MHEEQGSWTSLGLLFLRVAAGGMLLLGQGWTKLAGFAEIADKFPDPLGLGSSTFSLGLAVFAEALAVQIADEIMGSAMPKRGEEPTVPIGRSQRGRQVPRNVQQGL